MQALTPLRESEIVSSAHAPVQSLAFAQDMSLMAVGDTRRNVTVWYHGQRIHQFDLASTQDKVRPTERIRGLAFSPTGDTLYVAAGDTFRAFSMTTGQVKWSFRPMRSFGFLVVSPIALAVSQLGQIAVATDAGKISSWTPAGATRSHWWDNDSPRHLAFLDEERVVGCDSFSLCTWKLDMSRKLSRKRLAERVYGFAANAGKVCLRSIHSVEVWDVAADVLVARHGVPFGPPLVAMSKDGQRIFFSGTNLILSVRLEDGASEVFHVDGASVRSLALQPDERAIVAGCSDGTVRYWDLT